MYNATNDLIMFSSKPFGSHQLRTSEMAKHFSQKRRVYFFAAPVIGLINYPTYHLLDEASSLVIVQPHLPSELSVFEKRDALIGLLRELVHDEHLSHYSFWTDTAKAMPFIRHLCAEQIIYDQNPLDVRANPELTKELEQYADVVLSETPVVPNKLFLWPKMKSENPRLFT